MTIYVQGLSALAHYGSPNARMDVERCPKATLSLTNASSSLRESIEAGIWRLGIGEPTPQKPLEVLVSNPSQRSGSRAIRPRVWNQSIAPTAFRRINKYIYVSSPEFVFLQMSTRLEMPELIALGMELCGTYRRNVEVPHFDTGEPGRITLYNQPVLSTPRRLKGFLESMQSTPGCSKALKALEYVLPGSASPMETALYLLLCLPRRLGGYALPKPVLNPSIVFSKSGSKYTLRKSAKPDLYWKEARLDLEYDSDEFHDENQRAMDSMRRKALERMKVEVIELTREELYSAELLHATVLRIARRLKKRIRPEHEGGFLERRFALRQLLLIDSASETSFAKNDTQCIQFSPTLSDDELEGSSTNLWLDDIPDGHIWLDDPWEMDGTRSFDATNRDDDNIFAFETGTRKEE